MLIQNIKTSKYTAVIDIPAEKLHTKSKFIQISKPYCSQTITISNPYEQPKKKHQLQTKLIVEELQKAYNEDVNAFQQEIKSLKTTHEIETLKLEKKLYTKDLELKQVQQQLQTLHEYLRNHKNQYNSEISAMKDQLQTKDQELRNKYEQKQRLNDRLKQTQEQLNFKNNCLSSKFKQLQTQKDKQYKKQKEILFDRCISLQNQKSQIQKFHQDQIARLRDQLQWYRNIIQRLEKQVEVYKKKDLLAKQELQKLSSQTKNYMQKLKEFETQQIQKNKIIGDLHFKIQNQNVDIQKLLDELEQQKIYIEANNASVEMSKQLVQDFNILKDKVDEYNIAIQMIEKLRKEKNKLQEVIKNKQQEQRASKIREQQLLNIIEQIREKIKKKQIN